MDEKGSEDGTMWTLEPARYAKGMMKFKHQPVQGWKARGDRLAEALGGRYTNRERAYILSPSKAAKLLRLLKEGWDAEYFSKNLIPPEGKKASMRKIDRIAERVCRQAGLAMVFATSPDGMIEILLDVTSGFLQVGMGGEWWNGQIRPGHNTLHHKKEHVDEAYKPVFVDVKSKGYQVVVAVMGGFGYEHEFMIGAK